jgi:hypothetical protein
MNGDPNSLLLDLVTKQQDEVTCRKPREVYHALTEPMPDEEPASSRGHRSSVSDAQQRGANLGEGPRGRRQRLLADVSRARAAGFILGDGDLRLLLKQPLFDRLRDRTGQDPGSLIAAIWALTQLIDKASTTEAFKRAAGGHRTPATDARALHAGGRAWDGCSRCRDQDSR